MPLPSLSTEDKKLEGNQSYWLFLKEAFQIKGIPELLLIAVGISFANGTNEIAPAITGDSYARLYYGYTGPFCTEAVVDGKQPFECSNGTQYAQGVAAYANFIQYFILFIFGPISGSVSDRWSRKVFIFLAVFFASLGPISLVCILLFPMLDPTIFYICKSTTGLVTWQVVAFTFLADVAPPHLRAGVFTLQIMANSLAISLVAELASSKGNLFASSLAVFISVLAMAFTVSHLPETLTEEMKEKAKRETLDGSSNGENWCMKIFSFLRHYPILNRNTFFRLMTILIFICSIYKSGEKIVSLFYFQEHLGFSQQETANYVLIHSGANFILHSFLQIWLVQKFGERYVVIASFIFGAIGGLLYGVATNAILIYLCAIFSSLMSMYVAVTASMVSFNVEEHEQGKIQGVLNSLTAVANAIGPLLMNFVYGQTVNGAFLGPSTMFYLATLCFLISAGLAYALPPEQANSKVEDYRSSTESLLSEELI